MTISPATAAACTTALQIRDEAPCLKFNVWVRTPGKWNVTVRALPTFSAAAGSGQSCAIAWDGGVPQFVTLPVSLSERDRQWQENVLRNAALPTITQTVEAGRHTLSVWMVDPGMVIDTIIADHGSPYESGYTGPAETRCLSANGGQMPAQP
jgi:hypothetical protein